MKSTPFRSVFKVPYDIQEGTVLTFEDGIKAKVTKIKSVKFLDMRTMEVFGLCKNMEVKQ